MNDLSSLRVSAAGLVLVAAFTSSTILAAEPGPGTEASGAPRASTGAGDRPSAILDQFADKAHDSRVTGAWLSIGGGTLLTGAGLLTAFTGEHAPDGHLVWIGGVLFAATGIMDLFLPSPLERLERDFGGRTPGYSPARLEGAWQGEADEARHGRYLSGGIELTFAAAGVTTGALLSAGVGSLEHSDRTTLAISSFAVGGLLTLAGVLTLANESPVEKGYALAFPGGFTPRVLDAGVVSMPGGGTLQLSGTF
jgi:hypothetical protein